MPSRSSVILSLTILTAFRVSPVAGGVTPPLPDPASVAAPEPPVWYEPAKKYVSLTALAGEFYGLYGDASLTNLILTGSWEDKCEWDSVNIACFNASCGIPLDHLWLKPRFDMYRYQRDDEFLNLDPSLAASTALPPAVISGDVHYQKWTVNGSDYYEQHGLVEIAFDRLKHVPQLEYSAIRNAFCSKARLTAQLNVRNLHLAIGSAFFNDFPSPSLQIKFLTPHLKVENEIRSGNVFKTYGSYIDFENPARMYPGLPEESLRVSAASQIRLERESYSFSALGTYNNWYSRIVTSNDYHPALQNDIEEINLEFYGRIRIKGTHAALENSMSVQYNWTSRRVPFLPPYAGADTITFIYKYARIFAEVKYLSRRDGINTALPPLVLLNPGFGLEYGRFRIFLITFNVFDEQREAFDGYRTCPRQYAGGLGLDIPL